MGKPLSTDFVITDESQVLSSLDANQIATFTETAPGLSRPTLPMPWVSVDIGSVGLPGGVDASGRTFTVRAAGADIWGTSDAFRFVYQTLNGDGEIVARVTSVEPTHPCAKAGLMIRETLSSSSRHASMFVTPATGINFQRRRIAGGESGPVIPAGLAPAAPYWVKVLRRGHTFSGYVSQDGNSWVLAGSTTMAMSAKVYVGLAVTSHNESGLGASTFDNVAVASMRDIGNVGLPGNVALAKGVFTLDGSGAGIGGTEDAFHFVSEPLAGDGEIVARLTSLDKTSRLAKAGIMIREDFSPGARHVSLLMTPANGVHFMRRVTAAGPTDPGTPERLGSSAPCWVKVIRDGDCFDGYVSSDAIDWVLMGTATIDMGSVVMAGLVVTSHDNMALARATIDRATITAIA